MKVITVASDPQYPGCMQLKRSLEQYGWQYDIMVHPFEFGGQMKWVYEWCKANWGWFLYTDAYDTFALGDAAEVEAKIPEGASMVISAEKNCYPYAEKAVRYPPCATEWKYVNGGGFLATAEYFVKLYEDGTHGQQTNDQDWLTEQYLKRQDVITLDKRCDIFQTIAFEGQQDLSRYVESGPDGIWQDHLRVINNKTGGVPVFIHGNAQTSMSKIYKLL